MHRALLPLRAEAVCVHHGAVHFPPDTTDLLFITCLDVCTFTARVRKPPFFQVRCVVNLDVAPQSAADKDVFTVQPASVEIQPHEHRYVDVYFKPTAMRRYAATFTGNVEGGTDPKSKQLRFTLIGDGACAGPVVSSHAPIFFDKRVCLLCSLCLLVFSLLLAMETWL